MRRLFRLVAIGATASVAGCDAETNGPCVHTYDDPLIHITRAVDAGTGAAIPTVWLSAFTLGGLVTGPQPLLAGSPAFSVTPEDQSLRCAPGCGFGTSEGVYRFSAAAPGYVTATVEVNARYSRFDGGCPSSNSGSTSLDIRLAGASAVSQAER